MKKDGLLVLPGGTLQVGGGPPGDEGPRGKGWDRVYYDPITDDIVFESDEYPELNYRTPALAGPRQAAQDWADAAEQSASQAASSAIAVEGYKDDAELAAQQAAQDAQATAADRVVTGQDRQQTGLDRQQTGSDADATSADRVATGQDVQATAADRVATGQDRQQTGQDRSAAESAKEDAEDARDLAKDWANKPEDQVVDAGEYSAKHYAAKAGKSAADAEDTKEGLLDDLTVDATTLAPGAPATASWDGNAQKITFGIPEGQPGDVGNAVRWDVAQSLSGSEQQQARDNIGLGSAAVKSEGDFATSAQGGKADTAVQPGDLAAVATSGAYNDLTGKPTLGALAAKDKAHIVNDTTGTLPINRGGTNATTAAAARTQLGIGTAGTRADSYFVQSSDKATQAEAEAGSNNDKWMTPLRVKQAIDELAGGGGSWEYVAEVDAITGSAVSFVGVDLSRETLLLFNFVSYTQVTAALGLSSRKGGGSWGSIAMLRPSNAGNSNVRGAAHLLPMVYNGVWIGVSLADSTQPSSDITHLPIGPVVDASGPFILPDDDELRISVSSGSFSTPSVPLENTGSIIMLQKDVWI